MGNTKINKAGTGSSIPTSGPSEPSKDSKVHQASTGRALQHDTTSAHAVPSKDLEKYPVSKATSSEKSSTRFSFLKKFFEHIFRLTENGDKPLNPSDVNPQEIEALIREFQILDPHELITVDTTTHPEPKSSNPEIEKQFQDMHTALNSVRDELGGSPHFFGKAPTLSLDRKFLGIVSYDHFKSVVSKANRKQYFPSILWSFLAKKYQLEGGYTTYEHTSLSLQSYQKLATHLPEIVDTFKNANPNDKKTVDAAMLLMSNLTGLSTHIYSDQSPALMAQTIEGFVNTFQETYAKVKTRADAAKSDEERDAILKDFFTKAFDHAVCFPDRQRTLLDYAFNLDATIQAEKALDNGEVVTKNIDELFQDLINEPFTEWLLQNHYTDASRTQDIFIKFIQETIIDKQVKVIKPGSLEPQLITLEDAKLYAEQYTTWGMLD